MTGDPDPTEPQLGLGLERPGKESLSDDERAVMDALQSRVSAELDSSQGAWRRRSWVARNWPWVLALLCGAAFVFLLKPGALNGPLMGACGVAALAALVAFISVLTAPTHPSLSERLAMATLVFALVAFGLEVYGGALLDGNNKGFSLQMALACGGKYVAMSMVPLVLLLLGLRLSRFPVRLLHAVALTAAALSVTAVGIWRSCVPAGDLAHFCVAHVALPALLVPVLALVLWSFAFRRSSIDSSGPAAK